jgi:LuxR family maltose regulon positive regulatory protein
VGCQRSRLGPISPVSMGVPLWPYWRRMPAPATPAPLLETKLYVPRLRHGQVARPRLTERLDRGLERRLTLVSAPAGFGKTTLIAEWLTGLADGAAAPAWLSLDPSDDATTFWSYVIAALQMVAPGVGATSGRLLREPQPPPIRSILEALLNELSSTSDPVVLVLDDYHLVDAQDIHDGVAFVLEHLPTHVHVVIATRADPGFPLARLRARAELEEIRSADLRFTADEAIKYLNQVMGLDLTTADVAALEGRTEGWIAALQLAALSMQGRTDAGAFIAGFTGDDRYIVDYLVEEVLQRQPEPVRQFLLRTSILARLSGSSSDAVTGGGGGKAMLERLDRGNLFLVPLDDRRVWYRYHHLFVDVLRARLLDEQSEIVPELHRRASAWYDAHGEPSEAIRHALAAGDVDHAATLIELAMPGVRSSRQGVTDALGWFRALPDDVIASRPVLDVHYAGLLLDSGQLARADARLRRAEQWLAAHPGTDPRSTGAAGAPIVVDAAEFRRLPGSIAVYRTAQAHLQGDVAATMAHAARALDLVRDDDHLGRGSAAGLLALAHWSNGDLDAAHSSWTEAMRNLEAAGHIADAVGCAIALADIRIEQGRLRDAFATYERGLDLAAAHGPTEVRGAADMHVGMSGRFLERDDIDAAVQHLVISKEMGEHLGSRQNPYRWCVAMARTRAAEGDAAGALALLVDAERLYVSDFYPNVQPIAALRARIWIEQGRLVDARGWVRLRGLAAEDDPEYVRTFEHVTLARLLLAESRRDRAGPPLTAAAALLDRLLEVATTEGRIGVVIELLLLRALAHQMRGDVPAALGPLRRALALAEPEGYVRVFLDQGQPMAALLTSLGESGASAYVEGLLLSFGRRVGRSPVKQDLVDPLSGRELQVLRLLATDLDGPGIARELVVSLSTIRSHTKAIYAKLGVTSRRAAVRRGEDLGLLSQAGRPRDRASTDA